MYLRKGLIVGIHILLFKGNEDHPVENAVVVQEISYRLARDFSCVFTRIPVQAGADAAESDGFEAIQRRQLQTVLIAVPQGFLTFLQLTKSIHRADRMDNVLGWQLMSPSNDRISGGTTIEFSAFRQKPRAGGAMDGAIDAAAAEQAAVCCIDNRVDLEFGYVPSDKADSRVDG